MRFARPSLAALVAAVALAAACPAATPGLPDVGSIVCTPSSIPCGDQGKTAVVCTGEGLNLKSGSASFTWKCTHPGSGVPSCTYVQPVSAVETCSPFEDATVCESSTGRASIELHCSGRVREVCTLTVAQGQLISDPRKEQSRFTVGLAPACPAPDMSASDGGVDGGTVDASH